MINFKNGIVNYGDYSRIKAAMNKAASGEMVTLGFLGGSITQGCLSSVPETCYAYLVYDWWRANFPQAEVKYVNAGIGGTPSSFGVARVDDDLLSYKPDFCIVEFSVNDENTNHYFETYEGLIRHILKDSSHTGLMLVHNVRYDNMESAEDKHLVVGRYYDLPCVSMKHSVYPEVANGSIPVRDITSDDLHPNDLGHKYLSQLIIGLLEEIKASASGNETIDFSNQLPKPLTMNGYEDSKRLRNTNYKAEYVGFEEDNSPQEDIRQMFRYGYTARKKGAKITFYAECSSIAVQYRKSVNKPTPIARVIVDDNPEMLSILDGNFDEDWGDCLYTETVAKHLENKNHKIEIEVIEDHGSEDKVPFYLVSVIASKEK